MISITGPPAWQFYYNPSIIIFELNAEMKRPGNIMSVYVIACVNADGSINFNEFKGIVV